MKKKLNLILAVLVAGVVTTAYATCYLQGVVVAKASGDLVVAGGCIVSYSCGNTVTPSSCCSLTADVYANEYAYKYDLYSVTAGGRSSESLNSWLNWCDGASLHGWAAQDYHGRAGGGFDIYYYDPNLGTTAYGHNGDPAFNAAYSAFYQPVCHYLDISAAACN